MQYRIKELAQQRNMTLKDLIYRAGLSDPTIRPLWDNSGSANPRVSTLLAIADALGVHVWDLTVDSSTAETQRAA